MARARLKTTTCLPHQSRSKEKAQASQHGASTAQNSNLSAVESRSKGKVQIKRFNLSNSPNSKIVSAQFKPELSHSEQ